AAWGKRAKGGTMPRPAGSLQTATGDPAAARISVRVGGFVPRRAVLAAALVSVALGGAIAESLTARHSSPLAARLARQGSLSRLPVSAQGVISAALGADSAAYQVSVAGAGFAAQNPAQRLHLSFAPSGVKIASGKTRVGLSFRAVGYGASLQAIAA